MRMLEHRIPPPMVFAIIALAMFGAARLMPAVPIETSLRLSIAGVLVLCGLAFLVTGFRAFGRAGTTIDPVHIDAASALVTEGVFRYSRNPMYVGFTSLLAAWAVYLAVPWTILGPIAFALFITRFQIVPEERAMSAKFGAAYAEYRTRVRRWL